MPSLPIRALTLYKQGIGYFERRGALQEPSATLVVPRESLNDVLKSLDIVVHQGGPLLSVDYETPTDRAEQLEDLSITLGKNSSLRDLIAGLSGTQVLVGTSDGTQLEGRVVGIEADAADSHPAVLVLQQADALRLVALATITGITIRDERATADVHFLLDVSRKEQSRTSLTVRLAPGSHDVTAELPGPQPDLAGQLSDRRDRRWPGPAGRLGALR